jgi:hypothetical protein
MEILKSIIRSRMFELMNNENVGIQIDYNTLKEAIDYVNSDYDYGDKYTEFFINCLK